MFKSPEQLQNWPCGDTVFQNPFVCFYHIRFPSFPVILPVQQRSPSLPEWLSADQSNLYRPMRWIWFADGANNKNNEIEMHNKKP